MDRRAFLRTLAAGLAGTAVAETFDFDRLLWVPGAKAIFLPPAPVLTVDFITRQALELLERRLQFAAFASREYDRGERLVEGVRIRVSGRFA